MNTKTTLLMSALITTLVLTVVTYADKATQAQSENMTMGNMTMGNMTMEEATNASLAQYPDMDENADNVTDMEEETSALVGNVTGNMTSQNMTYGNMTS